MKTAMKNRKKRKQLVATSRKDDEKKKSKKKKKKIESNDTGIEIDDKGAKKSPSTSLMNSVFGGNSTFDDVANGATGSSSLIDSIFDNKGNKPSISTSTSSTIALFSNHNIPATKRTFHHRQEIPPEKKAKVQSKEINKMHNVETIRQTLKDRKDRSQNRPLLRQALDFPGVFENEEEDEENGFFLLEDEDERAKEMADAIREHGFCVLRNVVDTNNSEDSDDCHPLRDVVLPEAKDLQRKLNTALSARGIHHSTETFRFSEAASRCRGRTDVVFDALEKDSKMADVKQTILRNPKFFPVIRNLLGGASSGNDDGDVKLVYAGLIFSYPGSCDQPWHQDGEPLFPELPREQSSVLQASLPPYALNVFLPLEDGDGSIEKGPTEFLPGSHKWTDPDERVKSIVSDTKHGKCEENVKSCVGNSIIAPVLKQGDALIYDYRVCHRGTSNLFGKLEVAKKNHTAINHSENDVIGSRCILYLMYARPWFTDHVNFDYTKSAESLWDDQKSGNAKT